MKKDFNWPCTNEQAQNILMACYQAQVERRGGTYKATSNIQKCIEAVASAMTTSNHKKFGLCLCGLYGNGKTTMLHSIAQVYNILSENDNIPKSRVIVYGAKDFAYRSHDYDWFVKESVSPLLAIDDLGEEPTEVQIYGNVFNPIIDLIEIRYSKMLPTFITSNLSPKEISGKYGKRVADRLSECMNIIIFDGESFRRI